MYVCMYVCVCVYVYMYACMCVCVFVWLYVCMYVQSITAAVDKDYLEFDESLKELKNQNVTTFDFEENIPCSFVMWQKTFA